MKKQTLLIASVIIVVIISVAFADNADRTAYAAEEEADSEIDDTVLDVIDSVDLNGYQSLLDKINEEYNLPASQKIKNVISDILYQKSELNAEYLLQIALELIVGNVSGYLAQMYAILLVCLLLSLLKNMSSGFASHSTEKIVYLACYGMIVAIVLSLSGTIITDTVSLIETFSLFTEIVFPPLLTLMTAIGSVSAVGLYQPSLLFFSATILIVIKKIVLPLFYIGFVLTIVGHLSEELKFKKTVKTTRSIAEWTLSIFFGLFTMITTAKGIAGSGMDSFAVRSAKYALSGYVPIVGNYLKEGFDIVIASCVLVKNAVGVTAVILLSLLVLSPIIKILLAMFSLRITASAIEPFGENNVSSMLYDVSDCLKLLIVLILCVSFTLFIILMLILMTCNGGIV